MNLRPLARENTAIDVWDDRRIAAGTAWREEINAALTRARVAVLLISADFLASDFIAQVELPALLATAAENGVVVLPLVLSPSRFMATPGLGQLQALNDPARPLISLDRAEQEAVFVRTAEIVEGLLCSAGVPRTPTAGGAAAAISPLSRIDLDECLRRLGCTAPQRAETEHFLADWAVSRSREPRWRAEASDITVYLRERGEPEAVVHSICRFADQLLAWYSPHHPRGAAIYLSTRKVGEAWRLVRAALQPAPADERAEERLVRIHRYLLDNERLGFLPARLLLGGTLPRHNDELVYFSGTFRLDLDRTELTRVPGAAHAVDAHGDIELYGVVAHVFQNPDPFVYPLLRFTGRVGDAAVTMVLSRRNIEVSSMTASVLVSALQGTPIELDGVGTFAQHDGGVELHALACYAPYAG